MFDPSRSLKNMLIQDFSSLSENELFKLYEREYIKFDRGLISEEETILPNIVKEIERRRN